MANCCTTEPKIQMRWFADFEKNLPSLSGKRIAITGTTSGTGSVAALTCLKKGAEVFVLNRESERSQDALQELQKACPGASVHAIPCDLMDFKSVREAARQLNIACQGRLDVLANNAGIMSTPDLATTDGFDQQMQTNHLSHFLLTQQMLPALRAAAEQNGEARIVNMSSMARRGSNFDAKFVAKNGGKMGGTPYERYHQSKLANVLFTYGLADRLANERFKVIVATPGFAYTALMQKEMGTGLGTRLQSCFLPCIIQTAEDGTMGLLTGIAGSDVKSGDLYVPNGGLIESRGPVKAIRRPNDLKQCNDEASQKLLWEESEKALLEKFEI